MNLKKAFKPILLVCLFSILISSSFDVMGQSDNSRRPSWAGNKNKPKTESNRTDPTAQVANGVGVPLDGGLLALLAGAGVAYFAARRKKKES